MGQCIVCDGDLPTKRHKKFCSERCRGRDSNRQYQVYEAQKARGMRRKQMFIDERGGGCERCGYNRTQAALDFHHVGPKGFVLDTRHLANRTLASCRVEFEKCIVLCANCHREEHAFS